MHLLSSCAELKQWFLSQGKSHHEAGEHIRYMFESDQIERVMFEDDQTSFNQHFHPVVARSLYTGYPARIYEALRRRFPRDTDFSSDGGAWVGVPHGKVG